MATLIGPTSAISLGAGYHSPQVDAEVRLNTNESAALPPLEWRREAADSFLAMEHHRYPDRHYTELRSALALHHAVSPDQVFVANGSNEVLQTLFLAYGGPGRRAGIFEPTYALHSHIARLTHTDVVVGQRRPDDFSIDEQSLASVLRESAPEILLLCSPNNPTGAAESPALVTAAVERAPGLVVVDEAYGQFAPWTALDLFSSHPGVVVVRTFSKTWSMAALRLGYLIGPAGLVANLDQVVLPYHLDGFKQQAGVLALQHVAEMEERVAAVVAERDRVVDGLRRLECEVWPSDANFVLFRTTAPVWSRLLERSVLVRDCSSWPGLEGCLRVTVGTADENSRFLAALKEALE